MPQIYFNPSCSKCRSALSILRERGVEADIVRYLDDAPSREELEQLMRLLGIDDPRLMMRTGEPDFAELGLDAHSGRDALLDAIMARPILLERPILVVDGRAVIGRPPERVLDIL
jgi:arsenate reductase